jgi:hypothetical protein
MGRFFLLPWRWLVIVVVLAIACVLAFIDYCRS